MDHREMFDYWVQQRCADGHSQTFTVWLQGQGEDGQKMLAKIDLLDQVAGGWPETPVTRDALAEKVDALQGALSVWATTVSQLIERVTMVERHAQRTGMGEL